MQRHIYTPWQGKPFGKVMQGLLHALRALYGGPTEVQAASDILPKSTKQTVSTGWNNRCQDVLSQDIHRLGL